MESLVILTFAALIIYVFIGVLSNLSDDNQSNNHHDKEDNTKIVRDEDNSTILVRDKETSFGDFFVKNRIVGRKGEKGFRYIIYDAMDNEDYIFSNKEIVFNGKETELDFIIVNKYGVFIFEVKNYSGRIYGKEDDDEWIKCTVSKTGNTYEKNIRNPIKQVKREVYILANILRSKGIRAWVKGFVYFTQMNSPIDNEYVVWNSKNIGNQIHQSERKLLDTKTINRICEVLNGRNT